MSGKKLLLIALLIILTVAIPATLFIVQQQHPSSQKTKSSASLTMSPSTTTNKVNDTVNFAIKLDPGANQVSFVSLDISYDPSKLQPIATNALNIDKSVLPIVLQGPVYTSGRIRINLSTGNDPTAAIKAPATVGTLQMKALAGTGSSRTAVSFGSSTQILSVDNSTSSTGDSSSGENVLASTTPAMITIADSQTTQLAAAPSIEPSVTTTQAVEGASTVADPTPTTAAPTTLPTPTPTVMVQPTATPTVIPTATPTPLKAATPTPTKVEVAMAFTPTPATDKAVLAATDAATDSSTLTNLTPTDTTTPVPTLGATGPGLTFIGIGAFLILLVIGGAVLLFAV